MPAIDTTPSKVATSALQGIPFSALIGGPLGAAVDAQAQSAKTTIEFIQNVGLKDGKAIPVEFVYYADGREAKLIVPLLSILPIPYLAVTTVDIAFMASINASSSTYQEDTTEAEGKAAASGGFQFGWGPVSASAKFEASYSSKKNSKATQDSKYSVEYTMDVKIHAGQEDMPAGLAKVLNILGDSITPTANKANIQVVPSTLVANNPTSGPQDLLVTAILFDEKAMRAADIEITVKADKDPQDGDGTSLLWDTSGSPAPTDIIGSTDFKYNTDADGNVEFTIKLKKADKDGTQPAQRVKLKFTSEEPAASKTVTLVIPAFEVPQP